MFIACSIGALLFKDTLREHFTTLEETLRFLILYGMRGKSGIGANFSHRSGSY
jgi:hypothetical protein